MAKIQQSLPEIKRDGSNVLSSLWSDMIYAENSTSRFGGVLSQAEFIPKLTQRLQESPEEVLADFEAIRKHGVFSIDHCSVNDVDSLLAIDPSGIRFSVTGNILGIKEPRSTWARYFKPLLPVCLHDLRVDILLSLR